MILSTGVNRRCKIPTLWTKCVNSQFKNRILLSKGDKS